MKYLQEKQRLYKSWSLTKYFTECVENKKKNSDQDLNMTTVLI